VTVPVVTAGTRPVPNSRRGAAKLTGLLDAEDPSIKKSEAVRQHEEPIV